MTYGDPRRAAELDGAGCLEAARRQVGELDQLCESLGRDPTTLDRLFMQGVTQEPWLTSVESYRDLAGRYAELGFTDLALHWPRRDEPHTADPGVFEAIMADATGA